MASASSGWVTGILARGFRQSRSKKWRARDDLRRYDAAMRTMILASWLALSLNAVAQPAPPKPEAPIGVRPESIVWNAATAPLPPGSQTAVLEGNPRGEGMFTMRVRVPAGGTIAPHWHPRAERVTILSGAVDLGFGVNAGAVTRYGAGSFYVNPPRTMHFLSFPEATEMQITGIGPWELFTSDLTATSGQTSTATVKIVSLAPPAGSELTPSTVIRATVDYTIKNFQPATFWLDFVFESTTPGRSFGAGRTIVGERLPGPIPQAYLKSATGTITLTQELARVLGNPDLKRPIRARILMHEQSGEMSSRVPGWSDWIEFR